MTEQEFNDLATELLLEAKKVRDAKGPDYTNGGDRLSNFKVNAARLRLTPRQVWAVYFNKHIDAILTHASTGHLESEPIQGRLVDAINYLLLYWGLENE